MVWGGAGWVDFPLLFSLNVNDMPKPSHHVELALYADVTAIIATSRTPVLLVSYLQSYLNHLERWLTEWKITINVSRSSTIIFAGAGRRFIEPRSVTLLGEPINWVDIIRYLGVTLDKRLTWSPHIEQVSRRTTQRMGLVGPLLSRRSDLSIRNGVLLYKQLIRPLMDYACPAWRSAAAHTSGGCRCYNPSVFALLRVPLGTLVTGRFTRIWVFLF